MEFETPNGKKLECVQANFGVKVRFIGGGELPAELAGQYTTYAFAENAILVYLERLKAAVKYKPELNKEDYAKESIFKEEKPRKKVANAN